MAAPPDNHAKLYVDKAGQAWAKLMPAAILAKRGPAVEIQGVRGAEP